MLHGDIQIPKTFLTRIFSIRDMGIFPWSEDREGAPSSRQAVPSGPLIPSGNTGPYRLAPLRPLARKFCR